MKRPIASKPKLHTGGIHAVAFSPNGEHIATASDDTTACVIDVALSGGEDVGVEFAQCRCVREMHLSVLCVACVCVCVCVCEVWMDTMGGRFPEPCTTL